MGGEYDNLIVFLFRAFIIILLSGSFAIPFVSAKIKPLLSIVSVSLVAAITGFIAVCVFRSGEIELLVNGGSFFGEIPVRIDALSAWFILIINFTSVTGVLYGAGYLKSSVVQSSVISYHWILYILFQSSMLAVCMVQHSIAFILSWEIMSLSSLLLVLFDYTNPKVIKAGINYLVQMHLSVAFLTVAFIWVYFKTGTFDFKGISSFFGSEVNTWLFLIFLLGFGLKAGFLGLHTWLPQAHPVAPSHISGVMSGVIVKMGIYGIFRIITFLQTDYVLLGNILITISLLTGLFGIMNAAVHRDFKRMLAYCTIENIGIIGIGIGVGLIGIGTGQAILGFLGFGGALMHVLNHSLFKSLLFFSAGSVYRQTHTHDMDKLGGLIKNMPKSAIIFLVGAIAIGGIPPLNGFISEFLIYCGILQGINSPGISQITLMIMAFAGMSLIGGISLLAFTKTFGTIFLGTSRQKLKPEPTEVSLFMLFPQYLIIGAMLIIAFFPGYFIGLTGTVLNKNAFPGINLNTIDITGYMSVMNNISLASAILIAIIALVFGLRWILTRASEKKYSPTWGCGYPVPSEKMQYTGKSFSKSFGKLFNFILIEKKSYSEIQKDETFPESRKYRTFYLDIFEAKIIDPALQVLTKFTERFQFIQNGKIQAYVIYGIVFILTIFIGTILNIFN
jgi:formate hydrogenlyase subunit 3/multisubunit Na+/H+ antiporter MnhD subunit